MKTNGVKRNTVLLVLLVLFAALSFRVYRSYQQEALNRQLSEAILASNQGDAIVALRNGADPNTIVRYSGATSWWQLLLNRLHHQVSRPDEAPAILAAAHMFQTSNNLLIESLVKSGAKVNLRDESGSTPLYWAIDADAPALVELYLDHGANPNLGNTYDGTALTAAILAGKDVQIALLLLKHGADPNARDIVNRGNVRSFAGAWNLSNETPLMCTVLPSNALRYLPVLKELIKRGADVNAKDDEGRTVLMWAVVNQGNSEESVKALLEAGARVDITDNNRNSPLDLALMRQGAFVAGSNVSYATNTHSAPPPKGVNSGMSISRGYVGGQPNDASGVIKLLRAAGAKSGH